LWTALTINAFLGFIAHHIAMKRTDEYITKNSCRPVVVGKIFSLFWHFTLHLPSRIVANILWFIIVLPSGAKIKRPRFIATGQGFYRFLEDIGGG
ncbi:hypothetical protein LCGC14_1734510, partial [marine sediment metagenome]